MLGVTVTRSLRVGVLLVAAAISMAFGAVLPGQALAAPHTSSNVAIIEGSGSGDVGVLPESGTVGGSPADSFDQFTFTELDQSQIDSATLSQYDTVVLNQVFTDELDAAQEQALSEFVTSGGKLIIHDADGTVANDYSWLPIPASAGTPCQNCGNLDGVATVVESNSMVSGDPSSPAYIDVSELPGNTDAVGDANMLLSPVPGWFVDIHGQNDNNVGGAIHAYASDVGEIIYDGFDFDSIGTDEPSGNDWLSKLYFDELSQQWDPDGLPRSVPLSGGGGGPVAQCGRESLVVGVVGVCADSITGSGTLTASGNVTLDGGIAVGGPLDIDTSAQTITSEGVVSITLLRPQGPVALGAAQLAIDGAAATDPSSGKTQVAKITLDSISFAGADDLKVGGLAVNLPEGDGFTLYLDSAHGGGLIGSGTLSLPKLAKAPLSAAAALGFYASTPNTAQFLGGSLHIGKFILAAGWGFDGLDLAYHSATDTWTASGGMTVPIGSLDASGNVVGGRLAALSVNVGGQEVPLGDSGFFFTDFGGGVSGLVNGPLKISASTGGFWGVPKAPVEPVYLDEVKLTLNLSGAVTLDGKVSFITHDNSPLTGEMSLSIRLSPFKATGTLSANGDLSPLATMKVQAGAGFTAHAFSARGTGSLDMHLLDGSGVEVLSNAGVGASGTLCTHSVQIKKFGLTVTLVPKICQRLGFAAKWSQLGDLIHGDLGVLGSILGSDPESLVTVPVSAAARNTAAIRVASHRTLLFIDVHSPAGPPALIVTAPGGKTYTTTSHAAPFLVSRDARFNLTTITVVRPRPGTWHVRPAKGAGDTVQVHAETVHAVQPLRGFGGHAGTKRHGLTTSEHLTLRWRSAGLPAGVRVEIVRSRKHGALAGARTIARGLRANGTLRVNGRQLQRGANWLILVATLHDVPFAQVDFRGPAWRAASSAKKHHG